MRVSLLIFFKENILVHSYIYSGEIHQNVRDQWALDRQGDGEKGGRRICLA